MKANEYLNKVSEIFDTLSESIEKFKSGKLTVSEMQQILRKAWEDKPKEYMLLDEDLCEIFELDECYKGQVVPTADYEGPGCREHQNEIVEDLINDVPDWMIDSLGRLSVRGSNSLIQNIIGSAEWFHFAF